MTCAGGRATRHHIPLLCCMSCAATRRHIPLLVVVAATVAAAVDRPFSVSRHHIQILEVGAEVAVAVALAGEAPALDFCQLPVGRHDRQSSSVPILGVIAPLGEDGLPPDALLGSDTDSDMPPLTDFFVSACERAKRRKT